MRDIEYDLIATIAIVDRDQRGRDTVWTLTRVRAAGPQHISVTMGRAATAREAIETMRLLEPAADIPELDGGWVPGEQNDADLMWVTSIE